jgi:isopentenyl-diphosphate delta-isomerase type 1
MAGRIAVVDHDDRFVRWEERRVIHEQKLTHRSIQVLLFDPDARLILQLRHVCKQTWPRAWDLSCSGHVEESDYVGHPDAGLEAIYRATAQRELEEELGVKAELEFLEHFAPLPGINYEQTHVFRARSAGPFVPQPDEVEEIRAVTLEELERLLQDSQQSVTPNLRTFARWARDEGYWPMPPDSARRPDGGVEGSAPGVPDLAPPLPAGEEAGR